MKLHRDEMGSSHLDFATYTCVEHINLSARAAIAENPSTSTRVESEISRSSTILL